MLSLVHEQAYFSLIGRKFLNFASLSDYLSNVLDWLPTATVILVAYTMLSLPFAMRFRGHFAARQKAAGEPTTRQFFLGVLPALAMGVSGIAYGYFAADPASELWTVSSGFFFIWLVVLAIVVKLSGQEPGCVAAPNIAPFRLPTLTRLTAPIRN
ncbi:hypothetical protein MA20_02875 [Bradyrhizobium japonicum]|uniref:Uncharacterized protein n=1 Tax=Bradyrhizobium japonicum TaxID=375 RepID=A0A0A3Z726_BRAJP|nr:hypothetical protein MA20_02875 [Bradyrhizobium japonicum]